MIYAFLALISLVMLRLYLRQKRLNELFIRHFYRSGLGNEVTDDIYVNDLIKLYYDVLNEYNIQILADNEIIELKNSK